MARPPFGKATAWSRLVSRIIMGVRRAVFFGEVSTFTVDVENSRHSKARKRRLAMTTSTRHNNYDNERSHKARGASADAEPAKKDLQIKYL